MFATQLDKTGRDGAAQWRGWRRGRHKLVSFDAFRGLPLLATHRPVGRTQRRKGEVSGEGGEAASSLREDRPEDGPHGVGGLRCQQLGPVELVGRGRCRRANAGTTDTARRRGRQEAS